MSAMVVGPGTQEGTQVGPLVNEDTVSKVDKLLVAGAFAYIIMPVDLIPDFIPVLGWVDDAIIIPLMVSVIVGMLPKAWRRISDVTVELLMATMALFMAFKGTGLVEATWSNTIADFPSLSVGVTYLPIPIGGAILFLFVVERLTIGPPVDKVGDAHSVAAFD